MMNALGSMFIVSITACHSSHVSIGTQNFQSAEDGLGAATSGPTYDEAARARQGPLTKVAFAAESPVDIDWPLIDLAAMLFLNSKEAFQALHRFVDSTDPVEQSRFAVLAPKVHEMVLKGWGGVEVDEGFLDAPVLAREPRPTYLRLRDGRSITRMNAGSIMRDDGPAFWLAFPNGIDHPLWKRL